MRMLFKLNTRRRSRLTGNSTGSCEYHAKPWFNGSGWFNLLGILIHLDPCSSHISLSSYHYGSDYPTSVYYWYALVNKIVPFESKLGFKVTCYFALVR